MKNIDSYQFPVNNNNGFIQCLINQIFSPHIPNKYILRRLKLLNTKINLKPFFAIMLRNINSIYLFEQVYKYYNDGNSILSYHDINLSNVISYSEDGDQLKNIKYVLNILENKYDKYLFLLNSYIDFFVKQVYEYIRIFCDEFKQHISVLKFHNNFINIFLTSNDFTKYYNKEFILTLVLYLQILTQDFILIKLQDNTNKLDALKFILPFVPYFPIHIKDRKSTVDILIKMNLVRHYIKVWLRKRNKIVKIAKRIEQYNIEQSMLTNSFTQPPRRTSFELETIKETKDGFYMISEKADGCLVDFISNTVEPVVPEYITILKLSSLKIWICI